MDKNQIIILADALTYLLTFIYWLVKLKRLNVGLIILAIILYLISVQSSIMPFKSNSAFFMATFRFFRLYIFTC